MQQHEKEEYDNNSPAITGCVIHFRPRMNVILTSQLKLKIGRG
jgi:hypothetical protein